MPIVMEVQLEYDRRLIGQEISALGIARVQGEVSNKEFPAVIALRLRWDRPWRKDKSLDYNETVLENKDAGVNLRVHYAFGPDETKKVFAEIINKKSGKKIQSGRVLFSSINEI